MKRPERPTESMFGKVCQTGSSPTDSTRIDLSYSYRALAGVGSTSQSLRVQDGGKSQHAEQSASNAHSVRSSRSLARTFTRRNGRCFACKERIRTTNLKPQQPLIGMICTNADPRYAGRIDDKQGGDTIVTMWRVIGAIALNVELADESTWLWLTSEKMGFPLRPTGGGEDEERVEDLYSSQRVRDHLVAYHLAPAINDFILDENQECCNNELEQTLTLFHSEWSMKMIAFIICNSSLVLLLEGLYSSNLCRFGFSVF